MIVNVPLMFDYWSDTVIHLILRMSSIAKLTVLAYKNSLSYCFFKNGHSRPLFRNFRLFIAVDSICSM